MHPQPEQESIFRTVFAGRVIFGGIFRQSLRATTKKRSSTCLAKKCTPRQNPGYWRQRPIVVLNRFLQHLIKR